MRVRMLKTTNTPEGYLTAGMCLDLTEQMASHYLHHKIAERIVEEEQQEPQEPTALPLTASELEDSYTLNELKSMAQEAGIDRWYAMRKSELAKALTRP